MFIYLFYLCKNRTDDVILSRKWVLQYENRFLYNTQPYLFSWQWANDNVLHWYKCKTLNITNELFRVRHITAEAVHICFDSCIVLSAIDVDGPGAGVLSSTIIRVLEQEKRNTICMFGMNGGMRLFYVPHCCLM